MNKLKDYYDNHLKAPFGRDFNELDYYDLKYVKKQYVYHKYYRLLHWFKYFRGFFKAEYILFTLTFIFIWGAVAFILGVELLKLKL